MWASRAGASGIQKLMGGLPGSNLEGIWKQSGAKVPSSQALFGEKESEYQRNGNSVELVKPEKYDALLQGCNKKHISGNI